MRNPPTIAVVGATGAVGEAMLAMLLERDFPYAEVIPLASERSAGEKVDFGNQKLVVRDLATFDPARVDIALFSAGGSVSKQYAPKFAAAGAIVIDNSSAFRADPDVPLVVAEVNPDALDSIPRGIVANPNCSTMQLIVALAPLHRAAGIERINVATYQSVSGTGRRAIDELLDQSHALLHDQDPEAPAVYPHQIAFNVLPQVETFKDGDDYTTEERKVMRETRKIFGVAEEELRISATCARVPVLTGHSESINVQTREDLSPEECRELLAAAPGLVVVDDPAVGLYPTARDGAGRDEVLVGRIRRDPSHERCINLWVVGDNLRKGAALNAIQVAELLVDRGLVRVPAGAASF